MQPSLLSVPKGPEITAVPVNSRTRRSGTLRTASRVAILRPCRPPSASSVDRRPAPLALEPRQAAVSAGRVHEGPRDRLLHADRAGPAAAPARPAADAQALPERRREGPLLREALPVAPAGLGADGAGLVGPQRGRHRLLPVPTTWRRSCGWPTSPTSRCTRRCARVPDIETPTLIAFDLDPGPPATIVECARVALELREAFEHLGLEAFPKTSGSKGMQVYLPLNTPGVTYEDTQDVRDAPRPAARAARPRPRGLRHEQGQARRQGVRRLEPERPPQDDGQRLLAAGDGAPDGLDAADAGTRSRRSRSPASRSRSPPTRCSRASRSWATCSRRCRRWSRSSRASHRVARAQPLRRTRCRCGATSISPPQSRWRRTTGGPSGA